MRRNSARDGRGMSRTPCVTGPEPIAALAKVGFRVLRVKGSHHFLRNSNRRSTVVPSHSGETSFLPLPRQQAAIPPACAGDHSTAGPLYAVGAPEPVHGSALRFSERACTGAEDDARRVAFLLPLPSPEDRYRTRQSSSISALCRVPDYAELEHCGLPAARYSAIAVPTSDGKGICATRFPLRHVK